jgi:hypothetical protein
MTQRRLRDAVELLGAVLDVAPHLQYLDWARRWLTADSTRELGFDS